MSPQNRHNGFGDRWIGLAAYFLYLLLKRIENLVFPERKKEVGETSFLYFRTEHFLISCILFLPVLGVSYLLFIDCCSFFSATMATFIAIVFVILLLVSLRIFSWATEQYNKTGKYIRKFSKKPPEEIREKAPFVYGYILVSWFVFALLLWLNIKWL